MPLQQIKHRSTDAVLFEMDCDSIKSAIAAAVAADTNLSGADLSGANLSGANLSGADLSRADLSRAYLSGANLYGADLSGANLSRAYLYDADLYGADLSRAYLYDAYLSGANQSRAYLYDAYLSGANLYGAYLSGANLYGAYLSGADLSGADLSGAAGVSDSLNIDPADIPVIENIDAEILQAIEAGGTLDMSSWHGDTNEWCGTTHCRAGWAVHISGEKGKALQDRIGPQMAGALIYHASRPGQPAPWFFDSTENALADIRKCAAEQTRENE